MHRDERPDWTEQPNWTEVNIASDTVLFTHTAGKELKMNEPLDPVIYFLIEDALHGHMLTHLMTHYNLDWDTDQLPNSLFDIPNKSEAFLVTQVLREAYIQKPELKIPAHPFMLQGRLINVMAGLELIHLEYEWQIKED